MRLLEQVAVAGVAAEHDGALEIGGDRLGPGRIGLDQLHRQIGITLLELSREKQADIAAADDHHPLAHPLLVAEGGERTADVLCLDHHLNVVARQHLIVAAGDEELALAHDADADQMQIGKEIAQLAQGRVDDRRLARAVQADQPHAIVDERHHRQGTRDLQTQGDRVRHLDLGRDHHVDRQMVGLEEVGPARLAIGLLTDAGDLGRHVEQRVGHLTGDHVDFVGLRHGDQHVGVLGARLLEAGGMRGVAEDRLDVEIVADLAHQLGTLVDHRHVVAGGGQIAGDVGADQTGAGDDDFHGRRTGVASVVAVQAERLELAVQRRSLHADEGGRA